MKVSLCFSWLCKNRESATRDSAKFTWHRTSRRKSSWCLSYHTFTTMITLAQQHMQKHLALASCHHSLFLLETQSWMSLPPGQDITCTRITQWVKYGCQHNRGSVILPVFQRGIDFLCCLWNNVKTNKEKNWVMTCSHNNAFHLAASTVSNNKHLSLRLSTLPITEKPRSE